MLFNQDNLDIFGYPVSDFDPRMKKDWLLNHIDEAMEEVSKWDSNPREDLINLNKELGIDFDFDKFLRLDE
ncbi:MAG: hypothetical protein E7Z78_00970 [Methanobrevibacter thaueri]|jgi:hypothetical protein|uniref:hypothetical protein n=1 Tax=Methanobrevibacter thaueri TaxID=190975 RepID=UPI0026EFAAB1|nr:hypothetical protein [Methanobrevibacter thaueri]MBE6494993.1 hypothetical protein [Methanobrevibacter thaueri]